MAGARVREPSPSLAVPEMSEQTVDMRAILEKRYGIAHRSEVGRGRLPAAGVDPLPREGVAMRKNLC